MHGVALLYGERLEHGASWVHSCSVAQLGGRSARPIWPGSGAVLQLNEPWSAHTGKIGQAQGRIKCFFSFGSFGVLAQVPGGRCRPDHSSYTGGPGADALKRAPASSRPPDVNSESFVELCESRRFDRKKRVPIMDAVQSMPGFRYHGYRSIQANFDVIHLKPCDFI